MAEEKKTAPATKAKKIVDVAHPGTSAPATNSKSVIITHRPTMKDPMVTADAPAEKTDDATAAATSITVGRSAHAVIQPLASSPVPEKQEEPVAEVEATPTPDAEPVKEESTEEAPKVEEPTKLEASDKPTDAEIAPGATDAKMGTKDVQSEAEIAAADDAEAKRQEQLQELIETKKYYLPINSLEKERTKQFVLLGVALSIVLAAAWLDIAMDAGLVHISNYQPVTHFFSK